MANIVITSYEKEFKSILKKAMAGMNVKTTYNLMEASELFSLRELNILVLDLDIGVSTTRYLKLLSDKYNLFVILTGSSTKAAFKFMNDGFGEFIIKPDNYKSLYTEEFITSIVQRARQVDSQKNRPAQTSSVPKGRFSSVRAASAGSENFSARARTASMDARAASMHAKKASMSMRSALMNSQGIHSSIAINEKIITIASSTGGTEALVEVLAPLPEDMPPILIVQHFPPHFTKAYTQRIDKMCSLNIKVAEPFEYIERGTVYFAEAESHMSLVKKNNKLAVESRTGRRINGVMPAADVLFNSVAEIMKSNAIGIVLTGMGSDGAKGLLNMKYNGARTLGQNKETSIVYGMPKAAYDIGAVDIQLPLSDIAKNILRLAK